MLLGNCFFAIFFLCWIDYYNSLVLEPLNWTDYHEFEGWAMFFPYVVMSDYYICRILVSKVFVYAFNAIVLHTTLVEKKFIASSTTQPVLPELMVINRDKTASF